MLAIWQQMDILRVPSTAAGAAAGAAVAGTGSCHATLSDGGLPPNIAINAVTLRRGHSLPDSMSSSSTCSSHTQQSSVTSEHQVVMLSAPGCHPVSTRLSCCQHQVVMLSAPGCHAVSTRLSGCQRRCCCQKCTASPLSRSPGGSCSGFCCASIKP
jgi:hypothetical protein